MNKPIERILQLRIDQIRMDLGTQTRAQLNLEWVDDLARIVKQEAEPDARQLPQPIVFWDGEKYILASGFHRIAARKQCGQKTVECKVRDGDIRDAILFAASTNSDHGLQRTPADCRHVARILLLDPEWGRWSIREISRWCKIREHYVGEEKKKIQEERRIEREKEAARKAAEEEKTSSTVCRRREPITMSPVEDAKPKQEKKEDDADTVKFKRGGKTIEMKTGNIGKGPRTQKIKPIIVERETKELAKVLTQLKRSIPKAVRQALKAGWTWEQYVEECRQVWDSLPVASE